MRMASVTKEVEPKLKNRLPQLGSRLAGALPGGEQNSLLAGLFRRLPLFARRLRAPVGSIDYTDLLADPEKELVQQRAPALLLARLLDQGATK